MHIPEIVSIRSRSKAAQVSTCYNVLASLKRRERKFLTLLLLFAFGFQLSLAIEGEQLAADSRLSILNTYRHHAVDIEHKRTLAKIHSDVFPRSFHSNRGEKSSFDISKGGTWGGMSETSFRMQTLACRIQTYSDGHHSS